jgi:hypothetical protein
VCGGVSSYCPSNSTSPQPVLDGYYSTPLDVDVMTRSSQTQCEAGYYCVGGVRTSCALGTYSLDGSTSCSACAAGYYGAEPGVNETCSGPCHEGYWYVLYKLSFSCVSLLDFLSNVDVIFQFHDDN